MAETLFLEIVTPYGHLLSLEVDEITALGPQGEIGVLPGHSDLFTMIDPYAVSYKRGGKVTYVAVGRGFAEVNQSKVAMLVESAEMAEEIDLERAKTALAIAEEKILGISEDDESYPELSAALERAKARVTVAEK